MFYLLATHSLHQRGAETQRRLGFICKSQRPHPQNHHHLELITVPRHITRWLGADERLHQPSLLVFVGHVFLDSLSPCGLHQTFALKKSPGQKRVEAEGLLSPGKQQMMGAGRRRRRRRRREELEDNLGKHQQGKMICTPCGSGHYITLKEKQKKKKKNLSYMMNDGGNQIDFPMQHDIRDGAGRKSCFFGSTGPKGHPDKEEMRERGTPQQITLR
ncbi:hypothetical protein JOB18_018993 [Solea senegalensis]|uniref:Uncharacterized protein n=1 Tax=Solea senegalensis TaxID=28829 RepID=A0AAV6QWH0_SOLSE|nr:hypothetical protein JOB18_018993 [Solea senegalensis]